ncbi:MULTISPECIES: GIY-YIG nuclease family protein [Vibrio]|uniref:GIY-YIG nuclease family protein n=1 Tax=Vibrio TaxID=662 RepID=UPI0001B955FA|nr:MULTISPECIES: GIY-YIG nuclease family protein [Vibrio]EEX34299.1 hypothetical protein VIC_001095 [Vibrio coralliilyticus ATCC BAA-450]MDE3898342.1 GIY-YIG nuclease family protein [Vibrio sp. CC007]NOI30425.1 GIY-YIG nuclease family protein [Vibrio coralliilyticus]NOI50013.1 GIY-YIG nuclease family protein [Vibrio coralliilyticus]NRF32208.1 GIY-YIG nuclease family protein [Vibrio coralliilyticus]
MMKILEMTFDGYWLYRHRHRLPKIGGLYLVYTCEFAVDRNTLRLLNLIYVGCSTDIHRAFSQHPLSLDFLAELEPGQTLCIATTPLAPFERHLAKAALAQTFSPPCNQEVEFQLEEQAIQLSLYGRSGNLPTHFSTQLLRIAPPPPTHTPKPEKPTLSKVFHCTW